MHIDWATLGVVAVVAAAAALTVFLLVAFALVAWSARTGGRSTDRTTALRRHLPPAPVRRSPSCACWPPGSSSATACT